MHEGAIVQFIISTTLEVAHKENLSKVSIIHLRIGKMHQVVVEALAAIFEIMKVERQALSHARLEVEETEVKILCHSCGRQALPGEAYFLCPHCQSADIKMIQGDEMYLIDIEGER